MFCSFGQPRIKYVWRGHAYHACSAACINCFICVWSNILNRLATHFNISMFGHQTMFNGVWSPNIYLNNVRWCLVTKHFLFIQGLMYRSHFHSIHFIYFFDRERAVSWESCNLIGSGSGQFFPVSWPAKFQFVLIVFCNRTVLLFNFLQKKKDSDESYCTFVDRLTRQCVK